MKGNMAEYEFFEGLDGCHHGIITLEVSYFEYCAALILCVHST